MTKKRRAATKQRKAPPCVLEDCDEPAAPHLCADHAAQTLNAVKALGTFATDSYEYELAGALAVNTAPRLSGSKDAPMMVNERIADHRREVRRLLASWALNVADECNIGTANITGIAPIFGPLCERRATCTHESCRRLAMSRRPALPDMHGVLAGFLRRHHEWIMRQYFARDYAGEVLNAAHKAFALLNPAGVRVQRNIGQCPDEKCRGVLCAVRRDTEDLLPSAIKCNVCGTAIPSTQWVKFGRRVLERREKENAA